MAFRRVKIVSLAINSLKCHMIMKVKCKTKRFMNTIYQDLTLDHKEQNLHVLKARN